MLFAASGAAAHEPGGALSATRLLIAGDIAGCSWSGDAATAKLIKNRAGIVMTAGDNAYQKGSGAQYRDCYGPTWGQFKYRTHPVPGNHEWYTAGAAGYFKYWGAAAAPDGKPYYAFNAGTWRVYALVGDCSQVGGCQSGDPQYEWLKADLAAHPAPCVLAVWHQPLFTSGPHLGSNATRQFWKLLYRAHAELVVNGHNHQYERFRPMNFRGQVDTVHGLREFVVGTGGAPLYTFRRTIAPNSEVRNDTTHGVLRLRLSARSYDWKFIPVSGRTFTDRGAGTCH
jgi:acid phosphatase type 7